MTRRLGVRCTQQVRIGLARIAIANWLWHLALAGQATNIIIQDSNRKEQQTKSDVDVDVVWMLSIVISRLMSELGEGKMISDAKTRLYGSDRRKPLGRKESSFHGQGRATFNRSYPNPGKIQTQGPVLQYPSWSSTRYMTIHVGRERVPTHSSRITNSQIMSRLETVDFWFLAASLAEVQTTTVHRQSTDQPPTTNDPRTHQNYHADPSLPKPVDSLEQ